jgi:hypothetical protein
VKVVMEVVLVMREAGKGGGVSQMMVLCLISV